MCTLSLHAALPILAGSGKGMGPSVPRPRLLAYSHFPSWPKASRHQPATDGRWVSAGHRDPGPVEDPADGGHAENGVPTGSADAHAQGAEPFDGALEPIAGHDGADPGRGAGVDQIA